MQNVNQSNARIEDVELKKISEIWKGKKPRGLRFNDTDALIVTVKTQDGTTLRDIFFLCLKPDGTFNVKTSNRVSKARRQRLSKFLKHYDIADNLNGYNLREDIERWKGKKVIIRDAEGNGSILVS